MSYIVAIVLTKPSSLDVTNAIFDGDLVLLVFLFLGICRDRILCVGKTSTQHHNSKTGGMISARCSREQTTHHSATTFLLCLTEPRSRAEKKIHSRRTPEQVPVLMPATVFMQ